MGSPPGSSNDADFDLGSTASYTVLLPSNENVDDINVQTDSTAFDLGGNTLLVVWNGTGGNVNVGAASGQNGSLTVSSSAAGGVLDFEGRMTIGANGGTGSATFNNMQALNYGQSGEGVYVGVETNSVGTLIVEEGRASVGSALRRTR